LGVGIKGMIFIDGHKMEFTRSVQIEGWERRVGIDPYFTIVDVAVTPLTAARNVIVDASQGRPGVGVIGSRKRQNPSGMVTAAPVLPVMVSKPLPVGPQVPVVSCAADGATYFCKIAKFVAEIPGSGQRRVASSGR
jgi:hypothetical protein